MKNRHLRARGVTLMELLTVVVIIGILASIAIPSYRKYLLRSHRGDATTALLRLQAAQEKHMLQYGVYVTTTANIPNAHSAGGLGLGTTSDQGYYNLALAATATGYTATATPTASGGQLDDLHCRTYTVDENGVKRAFDTSSADSSSECFR
jgi:type IV pilus assembly protein PilE